MVWPPSSRDGGPFDLLQRLLGERQLPPDPSWESRLGEALKRAGVEPLEDRDVSHPISHESPASLFDALAGAGPLRSVARAKGPEFMSDLRRAFVAALPNEPVVHSPRARFLLAKR
jgi:hypothetical protein